MTRVLVAGLGNIFHGDDGIGVVVAQALLTDPQPLPAGTVVRDVGIRGVHLAYDLLDGWDLVVLVDAVQRGAAPGTVHVLEYSSPAGAAADPLLDAHDMAPDDVLALVPALGGELGRVVIVGCEVESIDPAPGISPAVQACVPTAVATVRRIVEAALTTSLADGQRHPEPSGTGGRR